MQSTLQLELQLQLRRQKVLILVCSASFYTCKQAKCVASICFTHRHTRTHSTPGNSLLMQSLLMPAHTLKCALRGNQRGTGSWVGRAPQLSVSTRAAVRAAVVIRAFAVTPVGPVFLTGSRDWAKVFYIFCFRDEEPLCKSNAPINRFGYSVWFLLSLLGVSSGSARPRRAHLFAEIE